MPEQFDQEMYLENEQMMGNPDDHFGGSDPFGEGNPSQMSAAGDGGLQLTVTTNMVPQTDLCSDKPSSKMPKLISKAW